MKWVDLSLKERKSIYDSVRAQNPDATYFDIKRQFDSIPEYEDGKNSREDQAWKISETVRLAMAGRGANQDSLQHIIDKANMQNAPRKYDLTVGAVEQGKQILHGLNNTIGTALTGASLGTMGLWNTARLLNLGKGTAWRTAAARNALTGAKAGLAADVGNLVEEPTTENAVQVGLSKVGAKDFTKASNKIVNSVSTGFDLYDFIPSFEGGGKKLRKEDLPPEYRIDTPEYFERQRRISGRAEVVQPEAYVTPAGYLKDAITTAEELEQGDYGNAAVSALMNVIPWGIGKVIRGVKSAFNPTDVKYSMFDEYPSVGTKTKSKKKTKKESDYDAEFSEVVRRERNIRKYDKEINKTIEDAVFPDKRTMDLLRNVDKRYNTDYEDAYKRIAMRDMTNRGKYVRYQEMPEGKNASISRVKPVGEYGPVIDDYMITIDPLQYLPGTANHELGHLADQLASNPDTNNYLLYLLDESNIMGPGELRAKGINISPNTQAYLLDPSEAKSHMLHLKRALVNEGKIHDWGSTVNQDIVESFLFDPRNSGVVNKMNQNQYNMYRDKSRFIQRMNQLTPMNYLTPMALPFVEYELNKE